jgi:hypothetical protein
MTDHQGHDQIRASELRDLDADAEHVRWLLPSRHRKPARTTTEEQLDAAIKADQRAGLARHPVADDVPDWLLPPRGGVG